jgi:hypothetical protein
MRLLLPTRLSSVAVWDAAPPPAAISTRDRLKEVHRREEDAAAEADPAVQVDKADLAEGEDPAGRADLAAPVVLADSEAMLLLSPSRNACCAWR